MRSYVQVCLREEILEEQLVRNGTGFRHFLEMAAQMHGKILNYSKLGKDVQVEAPTIRTYFDILEDTYLGLRLLPFERSIRKQQRAHSRFYFFDSGVWRAIQRGLHSPLVEGTSLYGLAFEAWLINEVHRMNEILKLDYALSFLQTRDGAEIDLILERPGQPLITIETRSTTRVDEAEVSKLEDLARASWKRPYSVLVERSYP